jgi:hypothetical protein
VNPILLLVPGLLVISGLVCFAVLPVPLWLRAVLLGADLLAASVIGFIIWRRHH